MTKVTEIVTYKDLPAEKVLDSAKDAELDQCIIIGYGKNRRLYVASTMSDTGEIFRLMQTGFKELSAQ
jgi:hypothetical protein